MSGWIVIVLLTAPSIVVAVFLAWLAEREHKKREERFQRSLEYLRRRSGGDLP